MKKIYTLLLSGLILFPLQAQVILTRSDLAHREGDLHSYNTTDPLELVTGISPETAGPNVSWDLSTLNVSILPGTSSEYVDPATTPFDGQVEGANLAIKTDGEVNGPYQFLNISDEGQVHYYTGWYEDGNTNFSTFTPPLTALEFPLSYGQTYGQEYVAEMYQMGSLAMIDSTTTSAEVDAWGTVTTPAGTFTDVLRIKRTSIASGYMYYNGAWVHTADLSTTDYTWYKKGIHTSLITVSKFEGDDGYTVIWLTNPVVTGNEPLRENISIRVYPNPACDRLFLEGGQLDRYRLYDESGRMLISGEACGSASVILQTGHLEQGVYILSVETEGSTIRRKIIIR